MIGLLDKGDFDGRAILADGRNAVTSIVIRSADGAPRCGRLLDSSCDFPTRPTAGETEYKQVRVVAGDPFSSNPFLVHC